MVRIPDHMVGTMVRVRWHGTVYHGRLYVVSGGGAVVDITLATGAERRIVVRIDKVLGPVL